MNTTLGLSAAQMEQALEVAAQAPSLYNTQPWRFRIRPDLIELHADPDRRLPATDPDGRELRLSCGAALFNLRLALRALGVRPLVTLLPDGLARHDRGSEALAVIRKGGHASTSPEFVRLLDAVPAVRIAMNSFQDVSVSPTQQIGLSRAVEAERSWLHVVVDQRDRAVLDSLVSRANRVQSADAEVRAELARWTGKDSADSMVDRWGPAQLPDVTGSAFGVTGNLEPAGSDPFVIMVCSFHSGPSAELQSGQALQHLLLTANTLGLDASMLPQPLAVPNLRAELRRELGIPLHPHAILRLGHGKPLPRTPCRPVADLMMAESARS